MATEIRIQVIDEGGIIAARQKGRELAVQAGFKGSDLTLVATAISELARNMVTYAGQGAVILELVQHQGRSGISIIAEDNGPGIANIEQAMQDGFSTGKSLGLGLPGARRMMDEFKITSILGSGTIVAMKKWAP